MPRNKICICTYKTVKGNKMAVMITQECITCKACAPECPVVAILDETNEKNPHEGIFYVKPESCVECVGHAEIPKCAESCPTEGAIVWDMPYTIDFNDYYKDGNIEGIYKIREHKKKGLMLPEIKSQPFNESISLDMRSSYINVGEF
jgi:ferredoxin